MGRRELGIEDEVPKAEGGGVSELFGSFLDVFAGVMQDTKKS